MKAKLKPYAREIPQPTVHYWGVTDKELKKILKKKGKK